jgi:hypothetical protein
VFSRALTAVSLFAWSLGAAQDAAPTRLTRAQQEEFLRTARMVAHRPVGKGVTNSVRTTLEKDGLRHDAHFQTINVTEKEFTIPKRAELNFKDSYKFNVAAYELAKLLGIDDMIPPSIQRSLAGNTGALTWWVDDVLADEEVRRKKDLKPPNYSHWNHEMQVTRVFDQLIANTDRNMGNLLIDTHWRVWMIDHTRAFVTDRTLLNPATLTHCDRALLARMRELKRDVLKEKLGRWVTGMEIDGLLERRDKIVARFDLAVKEQGENAVLFDRPQRD